MNKRNLRSKKKSHPFWRWFWVIFLVLSLTYAWYSFYVPSSGVKWVYNYTPPQELISSNQKNTLIFFTGKWCVPCRIMKREVFANKEIEKHINRNYTPVLIDVGNPDNYKLLEYYEVNSTPTTVIIDSQGNELEYIEGNIKKEKFLKILTRINP